MKPNRTEPIIKTHKTEPNRTEPLIYTTTQIKLVAPFLPWLWFPLKMIFAPWKSFLAPFLPWLWFRNKKALENDFGALKIVFGTVSTVAHFVMIEKNGPEPDRTGSHSEPNRTEPNRNYMKPNRTASFYEPNRRHSSFTKPKRTEPNRRFPAKSNSKKILKTGLLRLPDFWAPKLDRTAASAPLSGCCMLRHSPSYAIWECQRIVSGSGSKKKI